MDISRMYFPTVGNAYFYLNFLLGGGGLDPPEPLTLSRFGQAYASKYI